MEVKLVITPSEEMVQLVDKVINAFARAPQAVSTSRVLPNGEAEIVEAAARQVEEVFEKKEGEATPVRRRKTKAEIEAEKLAQQELSKDIEAAEKEDAEQIEKTQAEEIKTEAPKTTFVADVVKLRKMTINRSVAIALEAYPEGISIVKAAGYTTIQDLVKSQSTAGNVDATKCLNQMREKSKEADGAIPAMLLKFGYASVTAIAKDAAAAERYYNYLIGLTPVFEADNA